MEYRLLGATGLRVSALGYGASALGGVFGRVDEAEGIRTVRTALDLGVNLIDVSPYYGGTAAETVLGKALRGVDRSTYVLATKVGRYGDEDFDFSADRVTRSVDGSLQRLQCGHIDLIQCHDVEFGDVEQIVRETIPTLVRLRETGKVRFVGVTGYPVQTLVSIVERTAVDTVLSYCRYTLLDRELLRWTASFTSRGTGIINASPLAMGLLSETGPPPWHPAGAELREYASRVVQLCRGRGVDIAQVALRFALIPPQFASTLVGSASAAEITRNVRWAVEPLDDDLVHEIDALLSPAVNRRWRTGRPENDPA
jgi:L-galactose dehydrogenase